MKTTKEERDCLRILAERAFSGSYSVSVPKTLRSKVAAKLHACNGRLREVAHFFIDEAQAKYFAALSPEFVNRLLDDLDAKEAGEDERTVAAPRNSGKPARGADEETE